MKQLDNIHIDYSKIDGHNKDFNFIASPREDGKTVTFTLRKIWPYFKRYGTRTIILNRNIVDITEDYIRSFMDTIREFTDESIDYVMPPAKDIDKGSATLMVNDKPFLTFIALSKKVSALKKMKFYRTSFILMDEYICNPQYDEKYLPGEAKKFMDLYNTVYRDNKGETISDAGERIPRLKCYFLGNPVSMFNPYHVFWHMDTNKLKIKGVPDESIFQSGDKWVIWRKTLSKPLYELIKQKNPGYSLEGDSRYTDYALNGENVNDLNIRIRTKIPTNYRLRYMFRIEDKSIGVFQNLDYMNRDDIFYACEWDNYSKDRTVFCFDFNQLGDGSRLFSATERNIMGHLHASIKNRTIEYSSLEIAYLVQEIYTYL